MLINRKLSETITDSLRYFSVVTLTGPRQSGKTTLIRNLFPDYEYYSLENPDILSYATEDPIAFLDRDKGIILDEVQNAPKLLSYIQGIVDSNSARKFILSGSSQFSLLKNVSQSLAGRSAVFELLPLSYSEVSTLANEKSLDALLFDGFYPAIYSGANTAKYLYPSYLKTYLDKDVRNLLNIKDMMQFHTFLRLCAARIGSVFNYSALANEIGVSSHTISSWISVLEASYIIMLLPPYYENTSKRLIKSPKLYFIDTGLACKLLGINDPIQLSRDKMRGALFENFVISEALKSRFNKGENGDMFFYRNSNGNEIDLLLRSSEGLRAVEIKSAMTYNSEFAKTIKRAESLISEPISEKTIVYAGNFENTSAQVKLLNYKNLVF